MPEYGLSDRGSELFDLVQADGYDPMENASIGDHEILLHSLKTTLSCILVSS